MNISGLLLLLIATATASPLSPLVVLRDSAASEAARIEAFLDLKRAYNDNTPSSTPTHTRRRVLIGESEVSLEEFTGEVSVEVRVSARPRSTFSRH